MPRLVVDLTRLETTDSAPWTNEPAYKTRDGVFDMKVPGGLDGVRMIVLEGYSINGIEPVGATPRPVQTHLFVEMMGFRSYDEEVIVLGSSKGDAASVTGAVDQSRVESGFPLAIDSVPYTSRSFETPLTRVTFISDRPVPLHAMRVKVTGPNGARPLFTTMQLYLRLERDPTVPRRTMMPMLSGNYATEYPPDYAYEAADNRYQLGHY